MRDIKAMTLANIREIAASGNVDQMRDMLTRLADDLSSSLVVIGLNTPAPAGVIPNYNPETDGDYSAWLAANNID